ncbi:MAG TPA: Ppx/GppA phosphatase family protein [Caulobacteraceae bacterium]|jgi:exopolyphosphatase/guanosine-5'-triphosphate,3'-diphosphate pyrophosphatase
MPAPDARIPRDYAVIDVGSNSVRLVLYRMEGRAIWTVFNEKVLAGLGRGVETTGELAAEGVEEAMRALRRFAAVVDGARPAAVFTAATAAVREAQDGHDFVHRVERETGLKLRILTGEEEARYSALGVLAGAKVNDAVVGDLGGSSLELVRVRDGEPEDGVSLPLGPFSLGAPKNFEPATVRALAQERLREVGRRFTTRRFHAVGGAWRTLALIHMEMTHYPLKIAHHYEMTARDVIDTARFVAKQSKGSLERIEGVSKKRVETLPWAAMVVEALTETLGFERLWISAYGIREGMLLESMTDEVRGRDPLVEGCASLGARQGVAEGLGPALASWLIPAFAGLEPVFDDRDLVLIEAAARLADIGARLHPDHRADLAFAQVLRAPIAGQSHAERAFLAVAVHARYRGSVETPDTDVIGRLLDKDRFDRARAVGLAMRLGCDLSGRTPSLLWQSRLEIEGDRLVLTAESARADMLLGEQTAKRANALADALDLRFESRVT